MVGCLEEDYVGRTVDLEFTTSENYIIEGSDITLNNTRKQIFSDRKTVIIDQDKNKIFLDNFDYQIGINIFKSIGNIEVIDDKKNKITIIPAPTKKSGR